MMIRNKTLKRCTVALLIAVLLTFTVHRTVSVSAFAITGSVVAASLLATGAVYLGYLALTGAEVQLPREYVREYVSNIGSKFAQYGTGAGLYLTIYNKIFNEGINDYDDLDITLDQETLLGIYNTNKDISQIQNTLSFTQSLLEDYTVTTDFEYPFVIVPAGNTVYTYQNSQTESLDTILSTYTFNDWNYKHSAIVKSGNTYFNWYIYADAHYTHMRNILKLNGTYGLQGSFDSISWTDVNYIYNRFPADNGYCLLIDTFYDIPALRFKSANNPTQSASAAYPILTNSPIYVQSTGEIIETVPNENGVYVNSPQWPNNRDPNNDDRPYPLVPYVELPTSTPGTNVPSQWGINTGALLDKLEELADGMITAGVIGELINQFKESLVGSDLFDTYEYYTNEGDNYYYYYNNTFQDNDTYNNNTNIQDDEYLMPVDLNTLSTVANNEYIDSIKSTASDISQTVGDYVAFWHNVDYQTVYIMLGGAVFLLICGLIGKMGK